MESCLRLTLAVSTAPVREWRQQVVCGGWSGKGNNLSKLIWSWDTGFISWGVADGGTPSAKVLYYGIFLICYQDSSMYHIMVMYTCSVLLKYWFFPNTGHLSQQWTLLRFSWTECRAILSWLSYCQDWTSLSLRYLPTWYLMSLWQLNIRCSAWNVSRV